jgi:hypothetical protein
MLRACAGPDANKIDTGSLPEAVLFLISKRRERKKKQEVLVGKEFFFFFARISVLEKCVPVDVYLLTNFPNVTRFRGGDFYRTSQDSAYDGGKT